MDSPAAGNTLGTLGAVCWSIQLVPQIIVNYRRHHATGLQPSMMILWAWAGVPLGVYNIVSGFNVALKVQPQILALLSLVTWGQCYYYQRNWGIIKTLSVALPIGTLMAGAELGLIFALRDREKGHWSMTLMAVLSAVLLALGVLSHYVDIWKHRTVRGISFLFVGIDALGDVFSLASILFEVRLDILGMVIYGTELILWLGVFAAGGWYNLLPKLRKRWKLARGAKETRQGLELGQGDEESAARTAASGIALHAGPSSTSVFRTASRSTQS
ncbi:PQ loop repeat-domain-containing protein [Triangularia verruculosa]|uniref:PQ loop repeat-domain-containing protein n=1 Tax=Triangularia verruculosa TaxID=2587418 RepID=A0AAN7AV52_9PEZI|nr:PQ loop repeat-domain-containing protein [Triangularia verruculosa]